MIFLHAFLDGHPTQEDGTLRSAKVKLPDDFKDTLTAESLFSAIRVGHSGICFAELCSEQYVMLETTIATTSLGGLSVTSDDLLDEDMCDPRRQMRQIIRRLLAGSDLVVFYVKRDRIFGDPSRSALAGDAPPADTSSHTVQKRPRSPDDSESTQHPRTSPFSLEKFWYYTYDGKQTFFCTALDRSSDKFSFASDFSSLLQDHNTVLPEFSLIVVDIETALVGTSTKVVLFNHYEPDPISLLRTMLECHHDMHQEQMDAYDETLKTMAISESKEPHVKRYRSNCLVLPISFLRSTGLTDETAHASLTSVTLSALRSFGNRYRKLLGDCNITSLLDRDDVSKSIRGALSLIQCFNPHCSIVVTIQDFDTPATDIWLGRLEGSRCVDTTEHGICRWIVSNILEPLVKSTVVSRVYAFSRTTGMMEAIRTPLFPIMDLSSLTSFQDLCAPPVVTGNALLAWIYRTADIFPPKEVLKARQRELLEISGTPYTSEEGVQKYGPRLRYTFLVSVFQLAWLNRTNPKVSLLPRFTDRSCSDQYLPLGISSDIERAIAVGIGRMEPDQQNKLEDSSIHAGAPPFAVNVDRPFCYSDIPLRQLVREGSATSGALHLIEGSRKDPVSCLLLSLGLLLALTDRAQDGTCKVVFTNEQAKKLIREVFRTRVHTNEQITYSLDPVHMCRRLEKYYQSLPLTLTRDLQENAFHVMFMERLNSRDMYVGRLLSIPELRLKKGPDDRSLNDALNKPTSNLYVDCYAPEEGAVHELKVANASNVYAGTIDDVHPSTAQLRSFIKEKIDPIMEKEWPNADHWENGVQVDLEAELVANKGRPRYRNYSATLHWIDLIVKFRANDKDCYERVDTRFRNGIVQVRRYQRLVAAGEAKIVDGKVLGGTNPEGIQWSVIESKTTGKNTVIKAYIWMLLCGKYIIHYELPSIEKAHTFHRA
ncbi:hypothetical protein BDZ89DRAFT_1163678 [Hymenopellis radicata]|nr:hypothetical protein BDZ89DRAFT_1163678 [Hymenopellis radicata]